MMARCWEERRDNQPPRHLTRPETTVLMKAAVQSVRLEARLARPALRARSVRSEQKKNKTSSRSAVTPSWKSSVNMRVRLCWLMEERSTRSALLCTSSRPPDLWNLSARLEKSELR